MPETKSMSHLMHHHILDTLLNDVISHHSTLKEWAKKIKGVGIKSVL